MSFHLQYTLTRSQRLIPLLRIHGPFFTPFAVAMFLFFSFAAAFSLFLLNISGVATFALLAFVTLSLYTRLFLDLFDIVAFRKRYMDIAVADDAATILIGTKRFYFFLDSITEIRKYRSDIWTLRHAHGTVVNIPANLLTDDQLAHIKSAMEYARTPEGLKKILARGRKIKQIIDGNPLPSE